MFGGSYFLLPGQEFFEFIVSCPVERETELGREVFDSYVPIGCIRAVVTDASPSDQRERWRQLAHPVSHKLIMRGKPPFAIVPGCIFENQGNKYYLQTLPYDVAGLGHYTIFYCNERRDAL